MLLVEAVGELGEALAAYNEDDGAVSVVSGCGPTTAQVSSGRQRLDRRSVCCSGKGLPATCCFATGMVLAASCTACLTRPWLFHMHHNNLHPSVPSGLVHAWWWWQQQLCRAPRTAV